MTDKICHGVQTSGIACNSCSALLAKGPFY